MTLGSLLSLTDALVPNQVSTPVKVLWVSNLELLACRELWETHQGPWAPFDGYTGDTPMDTELRIPQPYDEVYRWYLELKLWDAAGEVQRYNNAAGKFNEAWLGYKEYVNRTHPPKGGGRLKLL